LCTSLKAAVGTGVQNQQLQSIIDKLKATQLGVTAWQGQVQAKVDEIKTAAENCKTKLAADVNGAMVDTDFQSKLQACQAIGVQVRAMAPTVAAGAMLTGIPESLLTDVKTCQTELADLRAKLQAKIMANAASCPGLTNVFTCVKRAAAVLQFKPSTLLGCSETLVDGLQNGIALFKSHVEKFCADAAHMTICDKFQPIINSAEASLIDVADPDPTADVKDALCRRAGTLKLRFPDPAAVAPMAAAPKMKRDGTNAELSAGLVAMCASLDGCTVNDESVQAGTPLQTQKSASGQQVDGVDNVVVPPKADVPTKPGRSSASSLVVAAAVAVVAVVASL